MTKLNKRSISLFLILVMLLTVFSTGIVCANTANTQTLLLEQYLTAIQNQDAETAANLYIDKRLGDNDNSQEINSLNELLANPNFQIKSYKILFEKVLKSDESSIFAVEIDYTNGRIEQIPILVQKENNEWSVIVDTKYADESMYKLINNGYEIISNQVGLNGLPAATRVATWDYSFNINDTYKAYTSNFNVTASQVTLNYRQWGVNGTLGIKYSVVKYGLFVDTYYATSSQKLNNEDSPNQVVLACGNRTDVCLRVELFETNSDIGRTFGEVYNQ